MTETTQHAPDSFRVAVSLQDLLADDHRLARLWAGAFGADDAVTLVVLCSDAQQAQEPVSAALRQAGADRVDGPDVLLLECADERALLDAIHAVDTVIDTDMAAGGLVAAVTAAVGRPAAASSTGRAGDVTEGDVSCFSFIEAQMSDGDKRALVALRDIVRQAGPYRYLEIGSHLGGSLQPFVIDGRCVSVVSIDPRPASQPDDRGPTFDYPDNSTRRMLANLAAIPGADTAKIRTIESSSEQLTPSDVPFLADLCFIDGEHTRRGALVDARLCRRVSSAGAIIAFHDLKIVSSAIADFLEDLRRDGEAYTARHMADNVFAVQLGAPAQLADGVLVDQHAAMDAWTDTDRVGDRRRLALLNARLRGEQGRALVDAALRVDLHAWE